MTSVVKAIHGQYERDDKIIDLVETMDNAYGFIAVLKESPDLFPRLEAIVEATLKETLECAMFMQEYCSVGFMSRLIRQSFDTPMRRRIDDFKASFEKLGASRQEGEVIQTVLTTTSILNVVTSLHRDRILQQLQPMTMDAVERSSCLPKTRIRYLRDISAWVLDASRKDKNILWLYGLPGSGKSAIANSIAQSFRGHSRLGAFLFFNDREHLSTPAALIRTLAAQLALFDERINAAVSKALQMNPDVTKSSLAAQFTQLLVGPLNSDSVAPVSGRGAVVVVIDALESCGNPASREELLSVLVNQCGQLPKWLRVVIISRKEQDIEDALGLLPNVCRMELDITCDSNAADIEIYLRYTMGKIATSPKNRDLDLKQWPSNGDIQALSRRSAGLIIWASRASSFVDSHNPRAQLETLLASDSDCTLLDGFFADTLRSIGSWDDPDFTTSFQTVMGAMIVAEEPMTHKMIDGLFNLHEHSPSLHTIKMLGCFLTRTPADLVQPLHPTLIQYLADPRRCQGEKWFVDASQHRHVLASRCLRLVVFHLTDNYSGSPRPDRSALEHLINHTPPSVRHAFRYWTVYISSIVDKIEELPSDIRLIFIPDNFLNWCRVIEAHWTSEAVVDLASRLLKWAKV
ncbi:hypothetical protein BXZ70DRAFT_328161 [Cristinia sonorae]|uniref:Nephrocystin 3-like N-terminal domain-containing protein n=1 Tax=Cristinia sonorae TaxID=1940300 RepID=A0A8K0UME8_9AGAR|nr:hypothetical protein BXZ70DRAFT_328161 [Cristinia sonorae]